MIGNNLSFKITVTDSASPALKTLKNNVTSLKSGLQKLGSNGSSSISSVGGAISTSRSNVKSFNKDVQNSSGLLKNLASAATKAVGVIAGLSLVRNIFSNVGSIASDAFERLDTMDLFQQKMTMITGSAENATKALEQLKVSTKGTPYALDIAAKAVQNFVTRGMETQKATDSVDIWMDAVSAYGKGTNEQFESVMDAIAKMRTKGTVEMRYLNRLFAAGINPVQMYAKATGQAAEDVQTALTKKTLRTEEFLDVVETAMREGTNGVLKIQGAAKSLAKTWSATFTNMRIAIVRGGTEIISALDESFKIFDSENGLKGLFKNFGNKAEEVLQVIAGGIRKVLPPIFQTAKNAFDYWKTNYFDPLKQYFNETIKPILDSTGTIRQAFKAEGDVNMNSLLDQIGYKFDGSTKDAFLEVLMTWENIKKIARDTWNSLVRNDQKLNENKDNKTPTFKLNFDQTITSVLTKIDSILGSIRNRTTALVTAFYKLSKAIVPAIGNILDLIGAVTGSIGVLILTLADLILPPAIDLIIKAFETLTNVLNYLNPIVKNFINEKLPVYIDKIIEKFNEFRSWSGFKYLSDMFTAISEKIKGSLEVAKEYFGFLNGLNSIERGAPDTDSERVIAIINNLRELPPKIRESLSPIRDALIELFTVGEFDKSGVGSAYSSFLENLLNFTEILKIKLPAATRTIADFTANIIRLIKPVAEWLRNLTIQYVLPLVGSIIRAFSEVGPKIMSVTGAFLSFGATLIGLVVPPALQILTNIFNWIADHSDLVVGGLIGILSAILAFKAISTAIVVISFLAKAFSAVSFAIGGFIQLATETGGIGSAIMAIVNPATLIPIAIAAFIGLAAALIYFYNTSDEAKEKILDFLSRMIFFTTGIKFTSDQLEETFSQIGDALHGFMDTIQKALDKIDEFFDKFPWLRKILGVFLNGPGYSLGSLLGDDTPETAHDIKVDTKAQDIAKNMPGNKVPTSKIKISTISDDLNQWNALVERTKQSTQQMVTQEIPEVGATLQKQVQQLQVDAQTEVNKGAPVDVSSLMRNMYTLPNNGGELGQQLSVNLGVNAQQTLNALQQLDPDIYTQLIDQLPTDSAQIGTALTQNLDVNAKATLGSLESLDPSTYTALLQGLPTEGLGLGSGLSTNIDIGAESTLNGLGSLDPSIYMALLSQLPTEGLDIGSGLGLNLAGGVSATEGNVNDATSAISNSTLSVLRTILLSNPTYQAGAGFIHLFNSGFTTEASSTYQMVAVFANNVLTQLAAGFIGADEEIPQTIATAMTNVVSIVEMKVKDICKAISDNLLMAKQNADTITAQLAEAIRVNFSTAQTSVNASIQQMKTDVSTKYEEFKSTVIEKLGAIEGSQTAFSTAHMTQFATDIETHLDDVIKVYQNMDKGVRDIISGLVQYFSVSGVNMMTGLEAGLESKRADVNSKTSQIVDELRKTFEGGLGIHSPSEWGKWIGEMLALGIILGLSGSKLDQFVSTTINDMQAAFNAGGTHFNPAETVDFLSEQGALDLIGRVSGLDMSNINPETIAYPLIGTMGTQTSWFGPRVSPGGIGSTNHAGIDLAAPTGTPIAAALGGNVTVAGSHGGYGNAVVIDSGNGIDITYGHMSKVLTSVGTSVGKGQTIGLVGSTGNSTGPHLHFEMHQNGHKIDPQPYIEGASISAGNTLEAVLRNAYNAKYHPELLIASSMGVGAEGGINWQADAGVAQWTATVQQALGLTGQPLTYTNDILYAIERESSGDPNKINNWDSNAAIGQNSRGLMQVIPDTFAAYAMPGLNTNIYDPLSNITAAIRYILSRYGNIPNMVNPRRASRRGWYGYAVGTRNVPEDMLAQIHKGEAIIPASQNPYRDSGGDYLGDLFSNVISNNSLEGLKLRDKTAGSTNYDNSSVNNNNNIVFNVYNNSDTDGDRFIGNLESELHRIFTDGQRVGTPR